jgi:hypothetical protein
MGDISAKCGGSQEAHWHAQFEWPERARSPSLGEVDSRGKPKYGLPECKEEIRSYPSYSNLLRGSQPCLIHPRRVSNAIESMTSITFVTSSLVEPLFEAIHLLSNAREDTGVLRVKILMIKGSKMITRDHSLTVTT